MYCRNCGQEINDNAVICPHCGVLVNDTALQTKQETNSLALVGFILSFFTGLVGLILSCIGLSRSKRMNGDGRGFAIAGIIISALEMVVWLFVAIFIFIAFGLGV